MINEIDQGYTRWIWYGERAREDRPIISNDRKCDEREEVDYSEADQLEDMIYDIEENFTNHPH